VEMTNKRPDDEMSNFIRNLMSKNKETEISHIFLQAVLEKSSKSLTHMNTFFERYYNSIQGLFKTIDQQYKMLEVIKEVWRDSNFHFPIFVEKMWSINMMNLETIISWLFLKISQLQTTDETFTYWETLSILIGKQLAKSVEVKEQMRTLKKNNPEANLKDQQIMLKDFRSLER